MKKQDIAIIAVLIALWMAWPIIDRQIIRKYIFKNPPVPAQAKTPASGEVGKTADAPAALSTPAETPATEAAPAATSESKPAEPLPSEPEKTAVLENSQIRVTVASRGGAVKQVEFKNKDYRRTVDPKSGPVVLDFSAERALAYGGLEGLTEAYDFSMTPGADGKSVTFERAAASGLRLRRTIRLEDNYLLKVTDEFVNEKDGSLPLPVHSLQTGPMHNLEGETFQKGMVYLGADTLSPGGEKVAHWGTKLPKWFASVRTDKALPKLPVSIDWPIEKAVDWVAAKNKYFAQILTPDGGGDQAVVHAAREVSEAEQKDPTFNPKSALPARVSVSIRFSEMEMKAGDKFSRSTQFYVGPKKYDELNRYGNHWVDAMEFGMWAPIGKILLMTLNGLDRVFHNYGVAIMLLTIIIRVLFWPVTHKSTESMKKMQEVQPLVNAIRAKYKDNAQKQQQEIMALYKEHKVNPLGGCLPMLVQIPVFIALFVVLRSAIELRFAPFLWVKDLSQPENLLAGVLPIPLNILPIFMAITMAWQQKLTPSAGDPNQQKMMMFMPVMMLVMFYNFASGLALYWSTNQCLMIAQQLLMKKKQKAAAVPAKA